MKLSFIGFGNMAQAIVAGLVNFGSIAAEDIGVSAFHTDTLSDRAAKYGVQAFPNNSDCARFGDMVFLCVKPYQLETVLLELECELENKAVVCIAAGASCSQLRRLLPSSARSVCVMPNTPIRVGQGILIVDTDNDFTDDDKAWLVRLFSPIALITGVDQAHMAIAGTLAGCTPAFAAMFLEALADAGVEYGLQRQLAYQLAGKVLEGTGALFLESSTHPGQLKDAVCSPAGTTIKGVSSLEKNGFRGDVIAAIEAIMNRSGKA